MLTDGKIHQKISLVKVANAEKILTWKSLKSYLKKI